MNKRPFLAHVVIKYFDDEITTFRLSRIIEEFSYETCKKEIEDYFGMMPHKVKKLLAKQEAKERIIELLKSYKNESQEKVYKEINGLIKGFGLNKSDLLWIKTQILKNNYEVPDQISYFFM